MRSLFKLIILGGFIIIYLIANSPTPQAELIEPTQTLGDAAEHATNGRLTILSEPPELEIYLDGNSLGKTPAFLVEVEAGSHTLRVKDSQTDIWIEPGKTVKISLYKKEFILMPVKEKKIEEQPEIQVGSESRETTTSKQRDPIKTRREASKKQTIKRWENFIDGTSPNF